MIEFNLDRIEDPYVREVLQRIREQFRDQVFLRGHWRFAEVSFTSNVTNFKFPHKLGFQPSDLIQTSKKGTGTITYNYANFDDTNVDITTASTSATDPLIARFFVGRYEEGSDV